MLFHITSRVSCILIKRKKARKELRKEETREWEGKKGVKKELQRKKRVNVFMRAIQANFRRILKNVGLELME